SFQYTERQRFESHPENAAPYHVLLGLLGVEDAQARGYTSRLEFQWTAQRGDAVTYFPETGHNVTRPEFAGYWSSHGLSFDYVDGVVFEESLALFGYPISEEFIDPESGLFTQYFERAVFEWHPNNPPEWQMLLRRLGADALERNICSGSIADEQTISVQAGCIVVGDVVVNGEELYDDQADTATIVVATKTLSVYAEWGAGIFGGDPKEIEASVRATGCGGNGCRDVVTIHR
ncbi:MAG TPA: hypothetical protein PLD54_02445, partial [Candidatus Levybacteria bacterium]|nr:hypothetical protein [Candidatus Levybacteria bacterium]